jgi:cellulase/cellobiase CelA1
VKSSVRYCARVLTVATLALLLWAAVPVHAEQPDAAAVQAARAELEAEYRRELESRLAHEAETYAASLKSLWISNVAVWTILLAFVAYQAVSARRLAAEIRRLKAEQREET